MQDHTRDFIDDITQKTGQPVPGQEFIPDGKWHRFQLAGDNKGKRNGYYRLTVDGDFAFGQHGNWREQVTHTWKSTTQKKLTPEEREAFKKKAREAKAKAEKEVRQAQTKGAARAVALWKSAWPATGDEDYLKRKGIGPHGAKVLESGVLLVYCAHGGEIKNVQRIMPDGQKRFLSGAMIKGCYYPIMKAGESKERIVICEGFATGASIREATGLPVVVAFNAGNLEEVAKSIKERFDTEIIIAADNDSKTEINGVKLNVGIEKAKKAAKTQGCIVVWPEFKEGDEGTDFNDAAKLYGLEYIENRIGEADCVQLPPAAGDESVRPSDSVSGDAPGSANLPAEKDWFSLIRWKSEEKGIADNAAKVRNAVAFCVHHPKYADCFVYDEFQHDIKIVKPLPYENPSKFGPHGITKNDITGMRSEMEVFGLQMGKDDMKSAIEFAAREKGFHPVREYFDTLKWDGGKRLDNWLIYYCGAEFQPADYLRRVGSCFLIAAAKRIYSPGTDFHHMLVLEGGQGAYKSTTLKTLCTFGDEGEEVAYFSDSIGFDRIDDPRVAEFLTGRLIVEFQELSGLTKKDQNKVKQWITESHDEVQKKYENTITKYPRQFVLAGTTNETHWMTDPTGGRRFWPVKVGRKIDIEGVRRDKLQLWAEAIHRMKAGELWYIDDSDPIYGKAKEEQSTRYLGDVWEDDIHDFIFGRTFVRIDEILTDSLKVPKYQWTNGHRARIANILRASGWENRVEWSGGKSSRVWRPMDQEEMETTEQELEF